MTVVRLSEQVRQVESGRPAGSGQPAERVSPAESGSPADGGQAAECMRMSENGRAVRDERKFGVLVMSHGSRDPEWVRLIDEAVAGMEVPAGTPVESSFLELVEGRLIQDGIDRLEEQGVTDIIAIPLFVCSGSNHVAEILQALGLPPIGTAGREDRPGIGMTAGPVLLSAEPALLPAEPALTPDDPLPPFRLTARVHGCAPLDDCPEMEDILSSEAMSLSEAPGREMVLLVGHGNGKPGMHRLWIRMLGSLAGRVRERCGFAAADYATLLPDELASKMSAWEQARPELRKIVLPLFLSEGYFTKQAIPSRLKGFSYVYDGRALLPHPLVSGWLTRQAALFLRQTESANESAKENDA